MSGCYSPAFRYELDNCDVLGARGPRVHDLEAGSMKGDAGFAAKSECPLSLVLGHGKPPEPAPRAGAPGLDSETRESTKASASAYYFR